MEPTDSYQKALQDKIREIKACQEQHGYHSCLLCGEFDDCSLHDAYVQAVYESMNKGQGGGFEF